jgi:integrase
MVRKTGFPHITETFNTKPEAETWAKERESEMVRGSFVDKRPLDKKTLSDLIDTYETEITPSKKGKSQETSKLNVLRASPLAKMTLLKIEAADIVDYRDARLKEVAPATVIKEMNLMSSIFNIAASEWRMRGLENPVKGVRRPKAPRGRERRLDGAGDEMRRILEATDSPDLKVLFPLAVETAMRRGEMVNVKREDVNLKTATIKLHDTKNGESREVPLSTRAIAVIKTLPERKDGQLFGVKPHSASQAFRRSVRRAREVYVKECEASGKQANPNMLTNLRLHDIRHEATSRLFELELGEMEVASITGHKDMRQLKRYTHLRAEDLAKKLG